MSRKKEIEEKKMSIYSATIVWDPMSESWYNQRDEDDKEKVGMTPEGGEPDFGFASWEDFWEWYYCDECD